MTMTELLSVFLIALSISACEKETPVTPIPDTDGEDTTKVIAEYTHHTDWTYNLSMYEVNTRQYTKEGTFKAFEQHLSRLKEMGSGILWFMPIQPIGEENRLGSLGSYYSVQDYKSINPEFGTMSDFKELVDEIHNKEMYIIIDWVANHTSWDNVLTETNPEFYVQDADGNFTPPPGTNWTDVIELDYANDSLKSYMIDALKYWITETGIDGFRFDAVDFVPGSFWAEVTKELKEFKPDIFMLAEGQGVKYHTMGFDMDYSWDLYGWGSGLMRRIYEGSANVSDMDAFLVAETKNYIPENYRLYFTSNHDENSWEGTVYEQLGVSAEVFAVISQTLYGMPLVYSGQESGLNKRLQFFDKDEILWDNLPLESFYSKLQNLKLTNSALWNGEKGGIPVRLNSSNDEAIFAFQRKTEDNSIIVLTNLTNKSVETAVLSEDSFGEYSNLFTNENIELNANTTFNLDAWDYVVIHK